jgi:aspartate aminotransferase-like enzyme
VTRFEPNLRIPGPTPLPPSVREAGGRQMINHRGPEFAALLGRIQDGMRPFFGTAGDVAILSCAGTGGLEAAIVNTLSPGDAVLGVSIGAFGDRFASIAEAYGAKVDRMAAEWGWAAAPDEVRERLGTAEYKAVLLTHNETSTGVMNPIPELAAAIRAAAPEALILVDSVSALGAVPFEMDRWGCDVVVTGSQKAWMAAPGLAMVAASERGWAAMDTARMPRFYLDLRRHRASLANGETPWTPAIGVAFQVDEGLRLMTEEGPEAIFVRHAACAVATRAALEALGFELFADPPNRSLTVTAARIPAGLDWKAFNAELRARGLVLAGGQGKLAGKVFRVGHLGAVTIDDILSLASTLEEVSLQFGRAIEPGRAVEAAERAGHAVEANRPSPRDAVAGVPAGG